MSPQTSFGPWEKSSRVTTRTRNPGADNSRSNFLTLDMVGGMMYKQDLLSRWVMLVHAMVRIWMQVREHACVMFVDRELVMIHMHARTHAHTHTRIHTRTHIHAHTYTHARARAHTHTHTHRWYLGKPIQSMPCTSLKRSNT